MPSRARSRPAFRSTLALDSTDQDLGALQRLETQTNDAMLYASSARQSHLAVVGQFQTLDATT